LGGHLEIFSAPKTYRRTLDDTRAVSIGNGKIPKRYYPIRWLWPLVVGTGGKVTGLGAIRWLWPLVVGTGGNVTGLEAIKWLWPLVVGTGGSVTGLIRWLWPLVVGTGGRVTGLATATVANTANTATRTNALKLNLREVILQTPLGEPCTERVTQKM